MLEVEYDLAHGSDERVYPNHRDGLWAVLVDERDEGRGDWTLKELMARVSLIETSGRGETSHVPRTPTELVVAISELAMIGAVEELPLGVIRVSQAV